MESDPQSPRSPHKPIIPPSRVKKIMQQDEEIGRIQQAAPVVLQRALEVMTSTLLRQSVDIMTEVGSRTLSPAVLREAIERSPALDACLHNVISSVPPLGNGDGGRRRRRDEPQTTTGVRKRRKGSRKCVEDEKEGEGQQHDSVSSGEEVELKIDQDEEERTKGST